MWITKHINECGAWEGFSGYVPDWREWVEFGYIVYFDDQGTVTDPDHAIWACVRQTSSDHHSIHYTLCQLGTDNSLVICVDEDDEKVDRILFELFLCEHWNKVTVMFEAHPFGEPTWEADRYFSTVDPTPL